MSSSVRNVRPVNSLYSVLRKNNFDVKKIEESLERDSSCIDNVNISDESPLCDVLRDKNCSSDVIRLVLRYGANVNGSSSSVTPLHAALEASRDAEVIGLLLENGANIQISLRSTLCVYFCKNNNISKGVVQLLLDAGCPPNECTLHGSSLHCAIDNMMGELKEDVLQLLIQKGADVNAVDQDGQSVLCFALNVAAEVRVIELLLSAGASLNCTRHRSPLLCATTLKEDLVKLLLDNGARTDEEDVFGYTPLQNALRTCYCDAGAINLLLDCLQGEEAFNLLDDVSRNLLHLAVSNYRCKASVVELLLKRGFLVNAECRDKSTPLHEVAVFEGNTSVINVLLKNGAEVNAVDLLGRTPFDFAVENWLSTDVVKALLAGGARIGTRNDHAVLKSVLDIVCRSQRISMREGSYECGLLIIKYYLLEDPQFDFRSLIRSVERYNVLSQFVENCVLELQIMELLNIGHNLTLREFLGEYFPPQRETDNNKREEKSYDFDQLLEKIYNHDFSSFLEIISTKVGRQAMNVKLQEVQVYTRKYNPDTACIGEIIILHNHCVSAIAEYLMDEDLLRFIAAFNYKTDRACTSDQDSEDQNLGNKRSPEESAKNLKRLKLAPESQ